MCSVVTFAEFKANYETIAVIVPAKYGVMRILVPVRWKNDPHAIF